MNKTIRLSLAVIFGVSCLPLVIPINRNLEYEYFLSLSMIFLLLAIVVGSIRSIAENLVSHFIRVMLIGFPVSLIPFLGLYLGDICPCSPRESLIWLLLQWLPHWFVCWGTLFVMYRLRTGPLQFKHKSLIHLALFLIFILVPIVLLIHFPQKRALTLAFGYLHGPIYDHWLPIDGGLIVGRIIQGLIGLFAILSLRPTKEFIDRFLYIPALLAAVILNVVPFPFQSHGQGMKQIKQYLTELHEGHGYRLHYSESDSPKRKKQLRHMISQIEFHLSDLNLFNSSTQPIEIFAYDTKTQKKLIFGAGETDVTDVFTPSIHIQFEKWPHSTLRHELVHAITSEDAYHGLGFHPNIAFTEGLAVALAPVERSKSLHESVKALANQNRLPDLSELFGPQFWFQSGRRAYRTAGSYFQFLIKKYGPEPVLKWYEGQSWEDLFPVDFATSIQHWKDFINEISVPENDRFSEALFRYPGIFGDLCPHSKAALGMPTKDLFPSWRQPEEWNRGQYLAWLQDIKPGNRRALLRSAYHDISMYRKNGDKKILTDLKDKLPEIRDIKFLEDFQISLLHADLELFLNSDLDLFRLMLQKLAKIAQSQAVGFALERQISLRLFLIETYRLEAAIPYLRYLGRFIKFDEISEDQTSWLHLYLSVRQTKQFDREKLLFLSSVPVPERMSENVRFEWKKTLALRAMQNHYYDLAKQFYQEALKHSHPGATASIQIFIREAIWKSESYQDNPL